MPNIKHLSMFRSIYKLSKLFSLASDQRLLQLSQINSFAGRIKFAKDNWTQLSSGSSRVVFTYSPDLVLKIAKNVKGLQQNGTESDGFLQRAYGSIVTNIKEEDPDDKWILVEKAEKITPNEFKALSGFSLKEFYEYLVNWKEKMKGRPPRFPNNKVEENDFLYELIDMIGNFDMEIGDFGRISSWGRVGNRLVLKDYGLTESTYNEYYR